MKKTKTNGVIILMGLFSNAFARARNLMYEDRAKGLTAMASAVDNFSQSKEYYYEVIVSKKEDDIKAGLEKMKKYAKTAEEKRFIAHECRGHKQEELAAGLFEDVMKMQNKAEDEHWLNPKNW